MATRYAEKYRRSPYPQATRMKTFNFLRYLSLGGTFLHPPQDKFSFFTEGDDYFYWRGSCPPHTPPPTSNTGFKLKIPQAVIKHDCCKEVKGILSGGTGKTIFKR